MWSISHIAVFGWGSLLGWWAGNLVSFSYLVQVNLKLNQMAKPLQGVMGQLGGASTSRVHSVLRGGLNVTVVNSAMSVAVNDNHEQF